MADHAEAAQRIIKNLPGWKGQKPTIPDGPEFPWPLEYLWLWFLEFSQGLKADGMGPVMASWGDVEAYDSAMQLGLDIWEKRALVRLASLRAAIQSEQQAAAATEQRNRR